MCCGTTGLISQQNLIVLYLELQIIVMKLLTPTYCLVLHLQEYDSQYFLEAAPRLEPLRCFTQTSFDTSPAFEHRTETDLFLSK
jgi:hypothetical protein